MSAVVLVAYATLHGPTVGVAETVAATLEALGLEVEAKAARPDRSSSQPRDARFRFVLRGCRSGGLCQNPHRR